MKVTIELTVAIESPAVADYLLEHIADDAEVWTNHGRERLADVMLDALTDAIGPGGEALFEEFYSEEFLPTTITAKAR